MSRPITIAAAVLIAALSGCAGARLRVVTSERAPVRVEFSDTPSIREDASRWGIIRPGAYTLVSLDPAQPIVVRLPDDCSAVESARLTTHEWLAHALPAYARRSSDPATCRAVQALCTSLLVQLDTPQFRVLACAPRRTP